MNKQIYINDVDSIYLNKIDDQYGIIIKLKDGSEYVAPHDIDFIDDKILYCYRGFKLWTSAY